MSDGRWAELPGALLYLTDAEVMRVYGAVYLEADRARASEAALLSALEALLAYADWCASRAGVRMDTVYGGAREAARAAIAKARGGT